MEPFTTNNGQYDGRKNKCTTVGGGVHMRLKAIFSILPKTTVHWENNHTTCEGFIYLVNASPLSCNTLFATLIPK